MWFIPAAHRQLPITGGAPSSPARLSVQGKFLFDGVRKFRAQGVTYGPFRPTADGCVYHNPTIVQHDFAQIAQQGMNAVRTYTRPPPWLLDIAGEHGLKVLVGVGLAGEQHVAFLDDRKIVRAVLDRCEADVAACAGHPAVMGYAIGNEIPAPIVRWHGRRRVERFLERMYRLSKQIDPRGLVTYVNFPTTEYLQTPFVDFYSYNVYLESPDTLERYLARLQNIADEKPLVMAEIGLDSLRNGEAAQAAMLSWQVRSSQAAGCAGAFVFAWTDEWHTGGADVQDWKFGITDAARNPKPALRAVREAFASAGRDAAPDALPRVSVVVCSYNGAHNIGKTLAALGELDYPDYEVIVVDDGSTDGTSAIAARFDVQLIRTSNRGLSHARNVGLRAARGELIAYIDDDAWPDKEWLRFLAQTFASGDYAGVGGPNVCPGDDPWVAQCVANAPGGPTHVLLTDRVAEHIPGCNMAFRTARLREIGGFDEQFRIAGDDVDVCWRLQEKGYVLGFSPAALVWHRRRSSVRAYLKQQYNYGRAEGMLEAKWPQKYNAVGHVAWQGRLYGAGSCRGIEIFRSRVYRGVWSSLPFQSLYTPDTHLDALPLMPEWYLSIAVLGGIAALGAAWPPLQIAVVLAGAMILLTLVQAARAAMNASFPSKVAGHFQRAKHIALTTGLHLLQPLARLTGRLNRGLTPWRRNADHAYALPLPGRRAAWSETWISADDRLRAIESIMLAHGAPVRRGDEFGEWDLEVRGGALAAMRTRTAIEEYPGGRQYVRFRYWPVLSLPVLALAVLFAALGVAAMLQHAFGVAGVLELLALAILTRIITDAAAASGCFHSALDAYAARLNGGSVNPAEITPSAPMSPRHPQKHADDSVDDDDLQLLGIGVAES